jgi:phosphate transport system substrate-binding protein
VLSKWAAEYANKTGVKLNYQSIGSGGGIAQIKAGTVDFGQSDAPMKPEELDQLGLGQFPVVIGGVVPVVNIEGVEPGALKFSGKLLADIFLGNVKNWNDPAIKALNPDVKLPDQAITVVHRSDASGTTFNFVNYLSKVSPDWKSKVGEGTSVAWPTGVGGKGNEGVAQYVNPAKGSIGYVEYTYSTQNKMSYGVVQNAAGNFIKPEISSFQAAAATADWKGAKDFYLIMTNAPGDKAYPITATSWAIMYKKPKDAAKTKAVFDFFKWAFENGQTLAEGLNYVPLPAELVKQIETYWQADYKVASN